MQLSDLSVKRPVFAMVLSLLLVAIGIMSFRELTVREQPNVTRPIVQVSTSYPGASSEVIESRITEPLEGELSGIAGIRTIRSTSRDGSSRITLEFDLDRDLNAATNDVRDRVSRAARRLPDDADPPTVSKADTDTRPIMWLTLTSDKMNVMALTDYMKRYLVDRFATIAGVSQVNIFGAGGPSMRIWLDRQAMTARQVSVSDIETALRNENVELPAGSVESRYRDFKVRLAQNFNTAEDFKQLVIRRGDDGHLIRLGEVADVEVAPQQLHRMFKTNGRTTTGFGIVKQSTANTVQVLTDVKQTVKEVNAGLPAGMQLITSGDDSRYIRAAIHEVYFTIALTTVLVGAIIFLFLGSLRGMVIPLVTIPVCLISSFIALALFGYSINLVTLLALVLSIGLVVDDAIVVLENVHRRIEGGEAPLLAAFNGTRQVAFAVLATTVVLVAVFAPVAFLNDSIGRIFAELGVTVASSVIFSFVLAMSLTPMMCSKLLTASSGENGLSRRLDRGFGKLSHVYERVLRKSLHVPWASVFVSVLLAVGAYWLLQHTPREYEPTEDRGQFTARLLAPEGTSYQVMARAALKAEDCLQPYYDSGMITRGLLSVPGWGNSAGIINVTLKPWAQRDVSTRQVMHKLDACWADIPAVAVSSYIRSGGGGGGGGGQPVQIVVGGPTYEKLAKWRDIIIAEASQNPGLAHLNSNLKETQPQVLVHVNQKRAASLGVSARSIGETLQAMMSEQRVSTYVVDGQQYDVYVQAKPGERASFEDLRNIFVRSDTSGDLIPLSNLITLQSVAGPTELNRYNRLRAVTITAGLANGYTLGQALDYLTNLVQTELPSSAQIYYRGQSRDFKESSNALLFTFGIALFVVFLVLAAQFESFLHPLVIMMTVPLAVAGGLLGLAVSGMTLNIYSEIGLIMLVGIAAKNGVLIVEFINQLRDEGYEFMEAIVEASRIRLRPVLMTACAALMGSVPLMLATGAGSQSRKALGVVVFSGVGVATLFTLFVVPAFYHVLARRTGSPGDIARELETLQADQDDRVDGETGGVPHHA